MKIKNIKDPIIFIALKRVCKYLISQVWNSHAGTGEIEAEFELAKERSKRYEDDIVKLARLDTDLNWGQKKDTNDKHLAVSTEDDFNPWYDGKLDLEDLLNSLESIIEFVVLTDAEMEYAEFIHYYELLKNYLDLQNGVPDDSFWKLVHPQIEEKCKKLFEDGNYPEAVEKSFKVVRDKLRELTGYETGSEAFGRGKLKISGALASHTEKDFNEGVKFLTMAIDRFRNEKAHISDAKIKDPVRVYEYLRLSSLAMNLLNQAVSKG